MAILGIIHRTILGLGPGHFRRFFRLALACQPCGKGSIALAQLSITELPNWQILGCRCILVARGGGCVQCAAGVRGGSREREGIPKPIATEFVNRGMEHHMDWDTMLSNRHLMFRHPLLKFSGFTGLQSHGTPADVQKMRTENANAACVKGWLNMRD